MVTLKNLGKAQGYGWGRATGRNGIGEALEQGSGALRVKVSS